MKVAYNSCYGGFGLSEKGIEYYLKLKDIDFDIFLDDCCFRSVILKESEETLKEKNIKYYISHTDGKLYLDCNFVRHDPDLIKTIEDLGEDAWGNYTKLSIKDIEDKYIINEYDGFEKVITPDDIEWISAKSTKGDL